VTTGSGDGCALLHGVQRMEVPHPQNSRPVSLVRADGTAVPLTVGGGSGPLTLQLVCHLFGVELDEELVDGVVVVDGLLSKGVLWGGWHRGVLGLGMVASPAAGALYMLLLLLDA